MSEWYTIPKQGEKREMVEEAFRPFLKGKPMFDFTLDFNALAESKDVIVIKCEVEHVKDTSGWQTLVNGDFVSVPGIQRPIPMFNWQSSGKLGTPGKYLFIGLPLEEEDG